MIAVFFSSSNHEIPLPSQIIIANVAETQTFRMTEVLSVIIFSSLLVAERASPVRVRYSIYLHVWVDLLN